MRNRFVILGSGSSLGVPRIDGDFGKCDPKNKKNYRTRCCAYIKFNNLNFLIDASPDIRSQLISNKIKDINYVFFTHAHADQCHGINDLRTFFIKYKQKLNVYADIETKKNLLSNFGYCFIDKPGYPAMLKMNILKKKYIFSTAGKNLTIEPIITEHGYINSISYLINKKIFYGSDVSKIFDKDLSRLKNLDYFVIDCLRIDPHPSHYNLNTVLNIVKNIKPKKTILTNLHSSLDYKILKKKLPKNITPAYDNLSFLL